MSDYDDRRGSRRRTRTKEPQYVEEEDEYIARGAPTRDLVLRPRDDEYDYRGPAEIRRRTHREEYGPPDRRSRSHGYREDYYDDDYSEYAPRPRRRQSRYDDDNYSDDYEPRRERRKSMVGGIIDDLGLGGVAAAVMKKTRSRSRKRRDSDSDRSRSRDGRRSHSVENRQKWQQAAKAAVITGVIEAVRSRNEPGGWQGKGTRVATAALGAAGIDGLLDRDPERKSKRHIVESVIGGLAVNHVASGPRDASGTRGRSRSRSRAGRSRSRSIVARIRDRSRSVFGRSQTRSRSRSRSVSRAGSARGRSQSRGPGLKGAAALGGLAVAGKAIYDRVRSKSRGRLRGRSRSVGSEDSYVPSRRPRYAQNRDNRGGPDNNRDYRDDRDDRNDNDAPRGRQAEQQAGGDGDRGRGSSTSSCSTTDLENRRKKTRGKELLTAGLATVATIHAAHGVYSSMVASEKRHKLVMEHKITPEEARKRKSKNILQDAAAVGIAALGIKSAFGEWKEMNESRKEKHEIEARRRKRLKAREQRTKDMKERALTYPQGGGGAYPPGPGAAPYYGDANPYQAYNSNLPPPPVGGR